ncbi:AAA family ATPase [uncultured Thiohalocapsa sp.]|uniref:AAA family ATPase n=1 Tax=uncultured Thiohalocapsa sp. TaxID=768990 RepID=UPI0025D6E62C|nr:AAA family ATPase [uncultured Thiohalocapsa sp.]
MTPDQHQPLRGRIASLTVRGFRSLAKVDDLQLPQLAVLIGANGAGKSNLIRFFQMLGWMLRGQNLQEFILRQGGGDDQLFMGMRTTPRLEAEIQIETQAGRNDYRFAMSHVASDTLMLVDEAYRFSARDRAGLNQWLSLPMPAKEARITDQIETDQTARVIVRLLRGCVTYQFHDTSEKARIKQHWDFTDNTYLRSDGANLAPILHRLREQDPLRYRLITKQIARVLPNFHDFELEPTYGKLALRWSAKGVDKSFGAHLTSDGSLRLFCLLTLLNLPDAMLPDILFLDEPELGLHPHAIGLVADMIKRVGSLRQVFLATQSPLLVDCFDLENIIVADIIDHATRLRSLPVQDYEAWLKDDYLVSIVRASIAGSIG